MVYSVQQIHSVHLNFLQGQEQLFDFTIVKSLIFFCIIPKHQFYS